MLVEVGLKGFLSLMKSFGFGFLDYLKVNMNYHVLCSVKHSSRPAALTPSGGDDMDREGHYKGCHQAAHRL